jgi:Icc-related predicted phosphoesterase
MQAAPETKMQVLTISDETAPQIYAPAARERFHDVKLVLACGDLAPSYLDFVVSTLNVPCLYVPGNHDARPEITEAGDVVIEPAGCTNIHGRVRLEAGLLIAGLGGSPWYNGEAYQYTEWRMRLNVRLLGARILLSQRRHGRHLDFMITHAAPKGIHDGPGAHRGFECFRRFIDRYQPRYFVHGHVHPRYGYNRTTESVIGRTRVINTVGYRLLDVPMVAPSTQAHGQTPG